MERYFKISESELLELLMAQFHLSTLEAEEVDNWTGSKSFWDHVEAEAKNLGLNPEEATAWDIVKEYLKDYPEA